MGASDYSCAALIASAAELGIERLARGLPALIRINGAAPNKAFKRIFIYPLRSDVHQALASTP
jgi:hypothetical protein